MAIEQVKTINELERITNVTDTNAVAISTGAATFSATAEQVKDYMTSYLERLDNKVTQLSNTSTNEQYPSAKAVYDLTTAINNRITDIMTRAPGWMNYQARFNITPNPSSSGNGFTAPYDGYCYGALGLGDTIGYLKYSDNNGCIAGRGMGSYNNASWFFLPMKKGTKIWFDNSNFWYSSASLSFCPIL